MSGNWAKAFSRGSGGKGQGGWGGRAEHRGCVPGEAAGVHHHRDRGRRRSDGVSAVGRRRSGRSSPRSGRSGRAVQVLGAGSNLLVSDGGVSATVLCTKKHLSKVVFLSERRRWSRRRGSMLPRLAVLCALSGLSGIEPLSGIPGTVGGALSMNAGAYGRSIGELVGVGGGGRRRRGDPPGRGAGDPVRVPGGGISRRRGSWCGPGSGSRPGRGRPCSSGCGS